MPVPRSAVAVLLTSLAALAGGGAPERMVWDFGDSMPGRPPAGFLFVATDRAGDGRWEVVDQGGNQVLAQLAPARGRGHRMALTEPHLRDLSVAVRIRFGEGDRTAGLVWRHQDEGRYYLAQIDLEDQRVTMYRVLGGNRSRLESEDDLELDPAAWHMLKIEHRGELMRVWVNGVPVGRARDRAIPEAGRLGLWVTARTRAAFDDLTAAPLGK